MKKIKSLISIILVCVLCVSLCACGGISREDAIGTWSGAYTHNGVSYSRAFALSPTGEYTEASYKNGSFNGTENGTWEIKGRKVILHPDGNTGISVVYKYKGGKLVNAAHEFTKTYN